MAVLEDLPQTGQHRNDVAGRLLIDGGWSAAASAESFDVLDPSSGQVIGQAAAGGRTDVDRAVAAARRTFDEGAWTDLTPARRARILWRVSDLIERETDRIAVLEVRNNGMPLALARMIVAGGAEAFRYYAGWCTKIHGITSDISAVEPYHAYTRKEPIGVVGLIVPWNGPFLFACSKIAPALAAGCTCILKPAEETPLTALILGELLVEAGVPAGVVNIVTGLGHVAGAALVEHPDVDKISFTGSTEVGRAIVGASARDFKLLTLELGGKSPVIVMPDADIEAAILGVAQGIFVNSGQICVAGSRAYLHRAIHDQVAEGVAKIARAMKIGNGFDETVQIGPLISAGQRDRVAAMVGGAVGDAIIAGGRAEEGKGFFFQPTVLQGLAADHRLMREEIFGPVIAITPFDEVEEVVRAANDTSYGLAAQLWTSNVATAHGIAKRLRAGTVWINCALTSDYSMPFGGYKQSGIGREYGADGLDAFLETKSVFTRL